MYYVRCIKILLLHLKYILIKNEKVFNGIKFVLFNAPFLG